MTTEADSQVFPKKPADGKSLGELYPDLILMWNEKNAFSPFQVSAHSNVSVWWTCEFHPNIPFKATVANMLRSHNCGCQTGHRFIKGVNDLASQRPDIAADWHEDNITNPDEISTCNKMIILWTCSLHPNIPYSMTVRNRVKGGTCTCTNTTGRKIAIAGVNDVATVRPDLISLWHVSNVKKPTELTIKANIKIAWNCAAHPDMPFYSLLSDMVRGRSACPCLSNGVAGRRQIIPGVTDLATLRPDVAAQWDYANNGDNLPSMVTVMSNELRWWKCLVNANHKSWKTYVYHRSEDKSGCPTCSHAGTSRIEIAFRAAAAVSAVMTNVLPAHSPRLQIAWIGLNGATRGRKSMSVDILGVLESDHTQPVAIEYDGAYYHDGVFSPDAIKKDVDKTRALLAAGYLVVRIRENDLPDVAIIDDSLFQVSHHIGTNNSLGDITATMIIINKWLNSKV